MPRSAVEVATATLLTEGQESLSKLEQPAAVYAALEDYVRLLFAFAKDSGDSDFPSLAVEHLLEVCTSPEVLASMARQLWEQARLSLLYSCLLFRGDHFHALLGREGLLLPDGDPPAKEFHA